MSKDVTLYEIRVFGLKRSGNHAIINWILGMIPNNCVFINNLSGFKDPLKQKIDGRIINRNLKKEDSILYNYEDFNIAQLKNKPLLPNNCILRTQLHRKKFNVMILRDPYNMFASRLKTKKGGGRNIVIKNANKIRDRWCIYAKEYLRETNFLGSDKVIVNFNKWFKEEEYRRKLSKVLGLDFSDKNLNIVSKYGSGSSFDNVIFNGNAQSMDILNRWQTITNNKIFKELCNHKKTWQLSKQIYGTIITDENLCPTNY